MKYEVEMPDADAAWFGAWLSADGCIGCTRVPPRGNRRGGLVIQLKFTITDRDPLDRMADLFGGKVHGPYTPSAASLGVKPCWHWSIGGEKAIAILERVYPWLSERYAARADEVIALREAEPKGRKIPPSAVEEIRERLKNPRRGLAAELAREYGVTQTAIWQIQAGRR